MHKNTNVVGRNREKEEFSVFFSIFLLNLQSYILIVFHTNKIHISHININFRVGRNIVNDFPVFWSNEHEIEYDDEGHRDPLRGQVILDSISDDLFRSANNSTTGQSSPGLTSLTDHLTYLVFHGWADSFSKNVAQKAEASAYNRLVWQHAWANYHPRLKNKYVLYGVKKLKGLAGKNAKPSGWETSVSSLVVLGPRERYSSLWNSLPEKIRAGVCEKYLSDSHNMHSKLTKLAKGNTPGLSQEKPLIKLFSLDGRRLCLFKELAKYLAQQPLSSKGLGCDLNACKLGDTLSAISNLASSAKSMG